MYRRQSYRIVIAVLISSVGAELALAQVSTPRPLSEVGGHAGQMLNQIYRSDVGTGYNSASLNMLALQNTRSVSYVGQSTATGSGNRPRLGLGTGGSTGSKPFANFTPEPTVSPYLNLFREDLEGGSDLNYNTLVRPMLQQQQINQQVQRQSMEMSRQLQSVAAQSDFNPRGSQDMFPTGHQTVYGYYGRFYPTAGRRRR
jgi:hypothetical protein